MALTDPENIPSEIRDAIEAAANDLGKGLIWQAAPWGDAPSNNDPAVLLLAQGFQRALTAIAMMVL